MQQDSEEDPQFLWSSPLAANHEGGNKWLEQLLTSNNNGQIMG